MSLGGIPQAVLAGLLPQHKTDSGLAGKRRQDSSQSKVNRALSYCKCNSLVRKQPLESGGCERRKLQLSCRGGQDQVHPHLQVLLSHHTLEDGTVTM